MFKLYFIDFFLFTIISNKINKIKIHSFFKVVNGELQDDESYVIGIEATTNDGLSVTSDFSEEVRTLPANSLPGRLIISLLKSLNMCLILLYIFPVSTQRCFYVNLTSITFKKTVELMSK